MFDDAETVFDPNPWGARQRVIPRDTFIASAPIPSLVPAHAVFAPVTLRLPTLPALPRRFISRLTGARYAVPLCGAVAVLALAIAYVLKPATEPTLAATLTPPPIVEVASVAPDVVVQAEPVVEQPTIVEAKPKPKPVKRVVAKKRKPIKLDASITSTPLGHLRPSR